ncbi:hypothetical protein BDV26DRAFT_250816 [Aspergillus bertholletiae]|uniref:Uncharacterized protein n=1 Tax=Aspergillus bertholletiae TaxID=1226010 RepID=A0A5N7BPM5_9EURO|nr:hypothetical protein BDV26DRAFT_250816 [Aspergillus bertholletiae]
MLVSWHNLDSHCISLFHLISPLCLLIHTLNTSVTFETSHAKWLPLKQEPVNHQSNFELLVCWALSRFG